ncbi:DUF4012 domain-containing protein [Arthrobacter sp. ISL-85]|nr:DUF4012 domain-containing protein [Arthrobacter sp. ISL-85]
MSGRRKRVLVVVFAVLAIVFGSAIWVGFRALAVHDELQAAADVLPGLKQDISSNRPADAALKVDQLRSHTVSAREAASDPLWTLASTLPWIGPNLGAAAEITRSADDVATFAVDPLVKVFASLDWNTVVPSAQGADLEPLRAAAPSVAIAAHTVSASAERLSGVESAFLLPPVADALDRTRNQLADADQTLGVAASASSLIPGMLGVESPRNYLLMIQNNAEARASGGIPGALAVVNFTKGKLSLGSQSSAGDVGTMNPVLPVDAEQQQIYSGRLGKYMQDVNLTPDFPTAASTAQAMWERKTGQHVDGVISIDPVVLSYILQATGPVKISGAGMMVAANAGLPTELSGSNVVQTMLSDVYAKIEQPKLQDAYFAGVAQEVFDTLSKGKGDGQGLITGLMKGVEEGRVLVWSGNTSEESIITRYPLSGAITGPSISSNEFGVYFNDGTGAKMDYYVKRSVQLVKECASDGYSEVLVRVTSTNTAPKNAGTVLPEYVTAGGAYGVPAGSIQTNIVAYGPVQANVESVSVDGQKTAFAPYLHANRPVGVIAQRLAPGETKTAEFTFGKIVQHTEPNLAVTPTVQPVKDVIRPTEIASCAQGH